MIRPDSRVIEVSCAEPVWDGPYRMTCGHYILDPARGCIRHGPRCRRNVVFPAWLTMPLHSSIEDGVMYLRGDDHGRIARVAADLTTPIHDALVAERSHA